LLPRIVRDHPPQHEQCERSGYQSDQYETREMAITRSRAYDLEWHGQLAVVGAIGDKLIRRGSNNPRLSSFGPIKKVLETAW
jgi:hypothetical protein